jgi:exonuclease SbcC
MDEQFIDFSELEKNGLFLICGETGAGKTTILDAMCYALYCESSGGQRGDIENMRCKLAEKTDETLVEFVFDSMGRRYKFSRAMKYKTKNLHKYHNAYIWNGEGWDVLETGLSQVTARAEQIVGLTSSQFRQVIILPQGKFEEFLVSDSKKKEEILVTLFNVQQWSRISEEISRRVNQRAGELEREKLAISEGLRRYGCDSLDALGEKRAALEEALEFTKSASLEAGKVLAAAEERYTEGKLESALFAQLDQAQQRFDTLKQQESAMIREVEILSQADAADQLRPIYMEFRAATTAAQRAEADVEKANRRQSDSAAALEKAGAELTAHQAGEEKHARNQKLLMQLEQTRDVYASLEGLRREAEQARKLWTGAEALLGDKSAHLQLQEQTLADSLIAQDRAKESYDLVLAAYRRSIGGILAQTLEAGMPCPVCGSTGHPAPAKQEKDHVSEKELDQKNKELTRCGKAVSAALQAKARAEAARNEAREQESQAKQRLDSAAAKLELALTQRIRGIDDAQSLEAHIRELQRRIRVYEQQGKALLDAKTAADAACAAAVLAAADCENLRTAARKAEEERRLAWEGALAASEFSGESDFLGAALDPARKQKRYQALTVWQAELKSAETALAEQHTRLEGKTRPDLAEMKLTRDLAEKESRRLEQQLILDGKLLKDMSADEKKLRLRQESSRDALIALEADQVFARRLAGHHGVGLQRYVLGVMMNSITSQANRLLENVYGGRYRLYRTDETTGRTLKGGLELEVSDSHNSQRRSVRTLSGGEKFLVALSLAIGLSTVVQAQGEGIRLEAMFIDEGFGSLDREAIQDALDILQGIRGTAGVVGIISHVDALAETIPARIEITKGRRGSSAKILGA